jgi:hypothetical protein
MMPYRQPAPTERTEDVVHVTNVAFWVLEMQKYGWLFVAASHIGASLERMTLVFERVGEL